jgi:hypothetical protein
MKTLDSRVWSKGVLMSARRKIRVGVAAMVSAGFSVAGV